ncbi:hypothetical protein [Streptomyces sp. NPDC059003]|uniref:hypothetical protein n=1 Tax=Streptomyces sp. NPDC059003 TaxID=3346691 RepID=UPI0036C7231B
MFFPHLLRGLAADTLTRLGHGPAVVVLGGEHDGKALLAAAISTDLHQGGIQASQILAEAARTVVGGGSGAAAPSPAPEDAVHRPSPRPWTSPPARPPACSASADRRPAGPRPPGART